MTVFKTIRATYQNYLLIPTVKGLILLFLFKNDLMRKLLYICLISLVTLSCDDGDIFEVDLLFTQVLELCGDEDSDEYLLYETKEDPSESLTLRFPVNNANKRIFNPLDNSGEPDTLIVNGTTIAFNYRTYNGTPDDLICQIIPEPGTTITNDYPAESGAEIEFISIYEDDDNDGVPSDQEGRGTQAADGSYPEAIDTDGDGLANYVDADDDNDNVLTSIEITDPNDDGVFDDSLDTDGDGFPNYLDDDDDGDGVDTRDEDEDGDNSLTDDVDPSTTLGMETPAVPRYLDFEADEVFVNDTVVATTYTRTVNISVTVLQANIDIINISPLFFGTYINTITLPEEE
jgi:hypothetical protein